MSSKVKSKRLVLGTVQLGLNYGVANTTGRPDRKKSLAIVRGAMDNGITEFDTAQGYGKSEEVLGECFSRLGIARRVKVISKIDPHIDHTDPKIMREALDGSLRKLRVPVLESLLLHQEHLLDQWENGIGDIVGKLIKSGDVKTGGISVYSVKKGQTALRTKGLDVIQIPGNVFDRRFDKAGFFKEAVSRKKRVYVRSVFLQGLLLMDRKNLPENLREAGLLLDEWNAICEENRLSRREAALGYARDHLKGCKIVFGVETPGQLRENMVSWRKEMPADVLDRLRDHFLSVPDDIINPTLWGKKKSAS